MQPVQTEFNLYGLMFPDKETELTKLEKKVFDLIPLGKENAVANSYIATTLEISPRLVTEQIRRLRLKSRDIGSTTSEGYYRFKDPQEYTVFMDKYSKEQARRKQVIEAMRRTPMAKKLTAETNQTPRRKTPRKE